MIFNLKSPQAVLLRLKWMKTAAKRCNNEIQIDHENFVDQMTKKEVKEYDALVDEYERVWDIEVEQPKKEKAKQAAQERSQTFDAGVTKPGEWKCETCDNFIQPSGKPGRPAKKCAECREKKAIKMTKKPKRLEMEVIDL